MVGRLSTLNREGVGFEIFAEKASGVFGSSKARGVDAKETLRRREDRTLNNLGS